MPLSHTAPLAAAGLIGGYCTAASTGNRPLGGVVLVAVGGVCALSWYRSAGPATAASLIATYVAAMGVSHPLAKMIGAWPSVVAVSAVTAAVVHLSADRRRTASTVVARATTD